MKTTLLTSILMIMASMVFAQGTFTFSPSDTVIQDIPDNSYTQIYIYEENQTNDSLTLGVEIISNEIPASWDGMVCIYGFCLINFPAVGFTSEMSPIHDTIDGYVRVTANPLGSTESGSISVRVYDVNNTHESDTCTFILNPQPGTSIEEYDRASVKVFPNPTSHSINLSSDRTFDQLRVLDIEGRVVLNETFTATNIRSTLVGYLPNGLYMAELISEGGSIAQKSLVINE